MKVETMEKTMTDSTDNARELPQEVMIWHSHPHANHTGTWSTIRYPSDAVAYVPRADLAPDSTDNARGPERIWWNAAPMPHSYTSTVQFAGGTEYIRAPATMGAVKVKSLDWVKHPSREIWRCDSMLGTYKAFGVGPTPSWDFDDFCGKVQISSVTTTLEAAKAAAQADYEARILSALEGYSPRNPA